MLSKLMDARSYKWGNFFRVPKYVQQENYYNLFSSPLQDNLIDRAVNRPMLAEILKIVGFHIPSTATKYRQLIAGTKCKLSIYFFKECLFVSIEQKKKKLDGLPISSVGILLPMLLLLITIAIFFRNLS